MHIKTLLMAGLVAVLPAAAGAAPILAAGLGESFAPSDAPGTVRQQFETVAGQRYVVEIARRAGMGREAGVRSVLSTATGGVTQTSTFDTVGQSSGALGWRTYAYSYVANGTPTTMVFAAAEGRAQAAALAPLTVAELPEPAIWAMMLFGFFGLSFAVRRRDVRPKSRVRFS